MRGLIEQALNEGLTLVVNGQKTVFCRMEDPPLVYTSSKGRKFTVDDTGVSRWIEGHQHTASAAVLANCVC